MMRSVPAAAALRSAMLAAAKNRDFDLVVTRDESRLGGDMTRTTMLIMDLLDLGSRLFYYFTKEEVKMDTTHQRFLMIARNFSSEMEREKISQRTHENLATKARKGQVTGGRCYGYDNIRIKEGGSGHVEQRINESQAAVVREIYTRYASGEGLRAIAKELNFRGVPPPRAGNRGTGSWSTSCIRAMLFRERYRGVVLWNVHQKTYRGGTKARVKRPESEWTRTEAPELRIVDEELAQAVDDRKRKNQRTAGKSGRRGPTAKYLLSGIARCGECGGPLTVANSKSGKTRIKVYLCSYHRGRGAGSCSNSLRRPVDTIDSAVIDWVRTHVLTEEVILETLKELHARIARDAKTGDAEVPGLVAESRKLKKEIGRLSEAIATSDEKPGALVAMIDERERRLRATLTRIETLKKAPGVLDAEVGKLEAEARERLCELKGLLSRHPKGARQTLEAILEDGLTCTPIETPEGRRLQIEGPLRVRGALFTTVHVPTGI